MHALWQTAGSRGHATASMYDFTRLARSVLSHAAVSMAPRLRLSQPERRG